MAEPFTKLYIGAYFGGHGHTAGCSIVSTLHEQGRVSHKIHPQATPSRHIGCLLLHNLIYYVTSCHVVHGRIARGIFPFRNPAHRFHLQCTVQRHGARGGSRFSCSSRSSLVVGGSGRRGGPRRDGGGGRGVWHVGGGSVGLWEQVQVPLWGGGKIWPESIRQCADWWVVQHLPVTATRSLSMSLHCAAKWIHFHDWFIFIAWACESHHVHQIKQVICG